ncbi:hypothetical protein ACFL3S_02095 [Gemmatimonadota bacterium]
MAESRTEEGLLETKRRVAPVVGLVLLEVIRVRDLPSEVFASEDPALTMPRRLGLSDIVDRQIRLFREEIRRGRKMSDEEVGDLFQLVLRRPDSEEVFLQAGELLAGRDQPRRGLQRLYPGGVRYAVARRSVSRRLRGLFGRPFGGFAHGAFTLEARNHPLLAMDPGGRTCPLVSGFCQTVLSRTLGRPAEVSHRSCQARGDELCRWGLEEGLE